MSEALPEYHILKEFPDKIEAEDIKNSFINGAKYAYRMLNILIKDVSKHLLI